MILNVTYQNIIFHTLIDFQLCDTNKISVNCRRLTKYLSNFCKYGNVIKLH